MNVVIIGGGLTGLCAAYCLSKYGVNYQLVEKENTIGGLCRTDEFEGFLFDKTLHVLHFTDKFVLNMLSNEIGVGFSEIKRKAMIYHSGELIPYPFQSYFYLHSNKKLKEECINGLMNINKKNISTKIENFEDYVLTYFGKGISKHFMIPYNEKLWKIPLSNLSYDWAKRFVPIPDSNEIISMANRNIQYDDREWGYNVHFKYPSEGGTQSIPQKIYDKLNKNNIYLSKEVKRIDINQKIVISVDGEIFPYDYLISTMPLLELIATIDNIPTQIYSYIDKLQYISLISINLGISGELEHKAHWIYYPEKKFIFHRLGFPSNISSNLAPSGTFSLSAEISYLPSTSINIPKIQKELLRELKSLKIIKNLNDINVSICNNINYAYIIYNKYYNTSLNVIHDYLLKHQIHSVGRYGQWKYSTMADDIVDGLETAKSLCG